LLTAKPPNTVIENIDFFSSALIEIAAEESPKAHFNGLLEHDSQKVTPVLATIML
jgi:hypothetical protein